MNGAGGVYGGIQHRSGADGCGTQANAGDDATAVHSCDGFVCGAVDHVLIRQIPRQNLRMELCSQTYENFHLVSGEANTGYLVGGFCPRTSTLAPLGEDQRHGALCEGGGWIIIGQQTVTGGGVNLIVVRVIIGIPGNAGKQAKNLIHGVVFHSGYARGFGIAGIRGTDQHRRGQIAGFIQGEGIKVQAIAALNLRTGEAIEGTLTVVCQGVGIDTNVADFR